MEHNGELKSAMILTARQPKGKTKAIRIYWLSKYPIPKGAKTY